MNAAGCFDLCLEDQSKDWGHADRQTGLRGTGDYAGIDGHDDRQLPLESHFLFRFAPRVSTYQAIRASAHGMLLGAIADLSL